MHNEDESVFAEIIVEPPPEEPVYEAPQLTISDRIAIYKLLKAGFTAEDFEV